MMIAKKQRAYSGFISEFIGISFGAFLAALSIQVFLYPNQLIDGGVVGLSLIAARLFGSSYLPLFLLILNLPFVFMAYRYIRKSFVAHMSVALLLFAGFLLLLENITPFDGDDIEIIVIGGAILGAGVGFIIRFGACTDGTEIMAIIMNKRIGFTVGQIVFFINIFIFGAYGWIFKDWHIALKSLLVYLVAFKMIDIVITGLDELKSVLLITAKPNVLKELITKKLGLGLTIIPGIGGFSGEDRDILFIIVERLDLAELKDIVLTEDPNAFMAVQNLHEVAYGKQMGSVVHKMKSRKKRSLFVR